MHRFRIERYKTFFTFCIASFLLTAGSGYLWAMKSKSLPAFWLACLAAYFAYRAYQHTLEKFRLDLFDRRYPFYQSTVKLCADGINYGLPDASAEYRGSEGNYSKSIAGNRRLTKLLFGAEITELGDWINVLIEREKIGAKHNGYGEMAYPNQKTCKEELERVIEMLPALFNPYLNFARYR